MKYLIITHPILRSISREKVDEALNSINISGAQCHYIDICPITKEYGQITQIDFETAKAIQDEKYKQEIAPFLKDNPSCEVIYFGVAPIPLAIHLGFLISNFHKRSIFLLDQDTQEWNWKETGPQSLDVNTQFVHEEFKANGDVSFKIESSYKINEVDLREVFNPLSLIKELNLSLVKYDKIAFTNSNQVKAFLTKFREGIDSIANYLPNAERIHLIASVPVGIAFLLGTEISKNAVASTMTYQYRQHERPKYKQAFIIQQNSYSSIPLTEEEEKTVLDLKKYLSKDFYRLMPKYLNDLQSDKDEASAWYEVILPNEDVHYLRNNYWSNLPELSHSNLGKGGISLETDKVEDSFFLGENGEWQFDNKFLHTLHSKFDRNNENTWRTLRLLIFHEALHKVLGLDSFTTSDIGRFPRILEEADYKADVYAMLHEYHLSSLYFGRDIIDLKEFFKGLINNAINTMWAFDEEDPETERMQVRRVNRYFIWYWKLIEIDSYEKQTLADYIKVFSEKPIIELKGCDIHSITTRTYYNFLSYKPENLEIGILWKERIERRGNSGGIVVAQIIEGFRERNGNKIYKNLKALHSQIKHI